MKVLLQHGADINAQPVSLEVRKCPFLAVCITTPWQPVLLRFQGIMLLPALLTDACLCNSVGWSYWPPQCYSLADQSSC